MRHWYYMDGSNRVGPVTDVQLRQLVSSGTVPLQTHVWTDGMSQWKPVSALMPRAAAAAGTPTAPAAPVAPAVVAAPMAPTATTAPPTGLSMESLRDPKEGVAFVLLCCSAAFSVLAFLAFTAVTLGGLLVFAGLFLLAMLIRNALAHAFYRVNAVEVTPAQFPEIHAIAADFARRLGQPLPAIYVIQDSHWNALAMRLVGQPVVVLHSAAVDSILLKGDMRQLGFLTGHELGHHYAGHLGFKHFVATWGAWFLWARLWWSRRCEFTCDRYGLACAGNLESAQLAVCNMLVGGQLAQRVNLAEAARQWDTRSGELFVRYYGFYSTHPHTLHRLAALPAAAAELGVPARAA